MSHVAPVSYTDVYIINPVIRSISGRHTITESDLGLPPGTLPPEDVASIGSLITVDKEVLRPFNSVRTATKRLCESKGVRVGMGTAVPGPELQATMAALEKLKDEFYEAKRGFLADFLRLLDERADSHPQYANLIKARAPSFDYVDRRMHFDIDVYKLAVPNADPNSALLTRTLARQGNDIGSRLFEETAEFVKDAYERTMKDSGTVVRRNLAPFRDTLLPKLRSFQLLDTRCRPAADLLEQMLTQAEHALNQIPRGQERGLAGADYDQFMSVFRVFLSPDLLEAHVAAHKSVTPTPPAMPAPPSTAIQPPANVARLQKRPTPATLPSSVVQVPRRPVVSF
jgi:hypothetical protein